MKSFPTLYKKTNTGATQQWAIAVDGPAITVIHGQVGGKLQMGVDIIKEGKNIGRANETTPEQQADLEAGAKYTKQLKKGYVLTVEAAQAGEVDDVIEGGILPMLAPSKVYPHFAKKLNFPVFVQPKLDGSRLIAVVEDGVATLWSRTRKRIHSLPHIAAALEAIFTEGKYIFDGEAYNHALKNDFEELMSLIRQDEPGEGHEQIEYHIYDLPSCEQGFAERNRVLTNLFDSSEKAKPPLVLVPTCDAANDAAIWSLHEVNLAAGYEGSMIRNDGPYEGGKRSNHLQKLKNFVDGEYDIVGMEEGRGKDAGTIGAFKCVTAGNDISLTSTGKDFKARLKATYARRRELFENPAQWQGKKLTVMYQNLTADGIPRFPIGKAIRDYE